MERAIELPMILDTDSQGKRSRVRWKEEVSLELNESLVKTQVIEFGYRSQKRGAEGARVENVYGQKREECTFTSPKKRLIMLSSVFALFLSIEPIGNLLRLLEASLSVFQDLYVFLDRAAGLPHSFIYDLLFEVLL